MHGVATGPRVPRAAPGPIVAQGASKRAERVAIIEDPGDLRLPPLAREALGPLVERLRSARARIEQREAALLAWHRSNQASRRLCDDPRRRCHHRDGAGRDDRRWRASSARADGSRPGSVWCPGNTRVAARAGGGRISKRGDGTIRRWLVQGARNRAARAPRQAGSRVPAGPTGSRRGGRPTSCWSPWPIRQPASPGHCSGTSVSTNRRPPNQLESGHQLARVTTI